MNYGEVESMYIIQWKLKRKYNGVEIDVCTIINSLVMFEADHHVL